MLWYTLDILHRIESETLITGKYAKKVQENIVWGVNESIGLFSDENANACNFHGPLFHETAAETFGKHPGNEKKTPGKREQHKNNT